MFKHAICLAEHESVALKLEMAELRRETMERRLQKTTLENNGSLENGQDRQMSTEDRVKEEVWWQKVLGNENVNEELIK